jgi:hypothetical protein
VCKYYLWLCANRKSGPCVVIPGKLSRRESRRIFFFSSVSSGNPLQIAAHVFVQWVYGSAVSERGEYRRCFSRLMTDFVGRNLWIWSLNVFLVLRKYVLNSSILRNNAITKHYRFPLLLTSPLYHVAAMSYIPFEKWGRGWLGVASHLEGWERRRK